MKKICSVIFVMAAFILIFSSCDKDVAEKMEPVATRDGEVLMVGVSKKNITPPLNVGIRMSGYSGRTAPFDGIHDDLFVRTIVITDQDDKVTTVHCSVDQLNFASGYFKAIHTRITSEIPQLQDLPISNIFITATHTHGGPSTADQTNIENRDKMIFESIKEAFDNRLPARMRTGKTMVQNVNVNRQNPHFGPGGNFVCTLETNPNGDTDNESCFMEFVDLNDKSVASMFTFGAHSTVMGLHNLKITGDLAGYAARYIEENTNADHVSLFLYSGGGDQSPIDRAQDKPFIDNPNTGVKAYGDRLGSQILPAFAEGTFVQEVQISSIARPIMLQRDWEPQDDGPDETETVALFGIRYNENIAVISTPFELFSSTVKDLRQKSPFEFTMLLSLTNGVRHYIPPAETYNRMVNSSRDEPQLALYTLDQCYENRTSIFTSAAEQEFREKCEILINDLHE